MRHIKPDNRRRRGSWLIILGLALTAFGLIIGATTGLPRVIQPEPAEAGVITPLPANGSLSVTFVALVCDSYQDILANKARNNIQESLEDLGPDSNYASKDSVTPAKEQAGQASIGNPCRPLPGLELAIGNGMYGPDAAHSSLSRVSGAFTTGDRIITAATTPGLDAQGRPDGTTLSGAVTLVLQTSTEINTAQRGNLWVSGGTPTDPVPVDTTGAYSALSFGALRCAADALNGDNVEHAAFPSGARHVYCYYYAIGHQVHPGTLVIVKKLADNTQGQGVFKFEGDVSYQDTDNNGIGDFSLTVKSPSAPQSQSFVRAAGTPWHIREVVDPDADWAVPGRPDCDPNGTSTIVYGANGSEDTTVTLSDGDTVTCTYTNARKPITPPQPVVTPHRRVSKEAFGGDGEFDFDVAFAGSAVVSVDDLEVDDDGSVTEVATQPPAEATVDGVISVTETVPTADGGEWELEQASCVVLPAATTVIPMTISKGAAGEWTAVTNRAIAIDEDVDCLLTNVFEPSGHITLRKTLDNPGEGYFPDNLSGQPEAAFEYLVTQHKVINAAGDLTPPLAMFSATSRTTPTDYTEVVGGPSTAPGSLPENLQVDTADDSYVYRIREFPPPPGNGGTWRASGIVCDNGAIPGTVDFGDGSIDIRLTAAQPSAVCDFV
ncbi:MAG: hypothetical protein LBT54_02860, partial [Bifidobacteriaceae bacterium]|nr:hypothetical protein [Bifidobacteriaceae bacterium]